jgi:hypothetical protein
MVFGHYDAVEHQIAAANAPFAPHLKSNVIGSTRLSLSAAIGNGSIHSSV